MHGWQAWGRSKPAAAPWVGEQQRVGGGARLLLLAQLRRVRDLQAHGVGGSAARPLAWGPCGGRGYRRSSVQLRASTLHPKKNQVCVQQLLECGDAGGGPATAGREQLAALCGREGSGALLGDAAAAGFVRGGRGGAQPGGLGGGCGGVAPCGGGGSPAALEAAAAGLAVRVELALRGMGGGAGLRASRL